MSCIATVERGPRQPVLVFMFLPCLLLALALPANAGNASAAPFDSGFFADFYNRFPADTPASAQPTGLGAGETAVEPGGQEASRISPAVNPDLTGLALALSLQPVKTDAGPLLHRPLWMQTLLPALLLAAAGLACRAFGAAMLRHNRRLHASPAYKRWHAAWRQRQILWRRLKQCPDQDAAARLLTGEMASFLVDIFGLPRGTTSGELASAIEAKAPDLAAILRGAELALLNPRSAPPPLDTVKLRQQLRHLLLTLAFCLIPSMLSCAPDNNLPPAGNAVISPSIMDAVVRAYCRGDYPAAAERLREFLPRDNNEAPHLLYNLGNCLFLQNDLPAALAAYERARRLLPRDPDIRHNLAIARENAGLAKPGSLENLRDFLRPDEWLLAAGALVLAWGVLAGLLLWLRSPQFSHPPSSGLGALPTLLLILALGALGNCIWQENSSYRQGSVGILAAAAGPLQTQPYAGSPAVPGGELNGVTAARLKERQGNWLRIQLPGKPVQGWLPRQEVHEVW